MAQIIWAPSAIEDVNAIAEYIARDSVDNAALFVTRLVDAVERLGQFPESGAVIPEIGDSACRQVLCVPYRVMYRFDGNSVWVTGVVHGARDWKPE